MPHPIVSSQTLAQLHELLEQFRQDIAAESDAWLITQAVLQTVPPQHPTTAAPEFAFPTQFAILISAEFSVLLQAQLVTPILPANRNRSTNPTIPLGRHTDVETDTVAVDDAQDRDDRPRAPARPEHCYQLQVEFAPSTIQTFLAQLQSRLPPFPATVTNLEQLRSQVSSNDPQRQSEFTLALIATLTDPIPVTAADPTAPGATTEPTYPSVLVWQPVQDALDSSLARATLISQVANQIRQSLDLPIILQTAVDQVRQLLQADRVVIYRMATTTPATTTADLAANGTDFLRTDAALAASLNAINPMLENVVPTHSNLAVKPHLEHGYVAYEAKASETIESVLPFVEKQCFTEQEHCYRKYATGQIVAVDDAEATYALIPCLLDFLRQGAIRAKLIAPIIVQEQLWGLLIVHQCQTRQWQVAEKEFMQHMASHLAIAIAQAQLYTQLQTQTQTLEQRVMERTQNLHDALRAAQLADHAKSEFLATMSHEFRTPLTCVIGMSATLLRWSIGEINDRQRNYLQTIHDSGTRLLELVNNILDMSQIEAGRTLLDVQPCSVSGLVSQVIGNLKPMAQGRSVKLELDLKTGAATDRLFADPRRVQQILQHLLSNAIKFTPEAGTVTLRVRPESQAVLFRVEDTGIGIAAEQRPLLFQKFQQLDPTRQRSYEGVGLGLALTKQLVDLHGGSLEVSSEVGVGSTFTVRIPDQRPRQPEQNSPSTNLLAEGRRALLFEPDESTANIICDLLTAAGMQVVWMIEGSALQEQVKLIQPDLLLIDVELPGLNPTELARAQRQAWHNHDLHLVLIAAQLDHPLLAACLDIQSQAVVIKPIQPRQLMQAINTLLYTNTSVEQP